MVNIIDAIGKDYQKIRLKDNESLTGGKSYHNETLGNLMEECGILPTDDYGELCVELEKCGLVAVRPIAHIDLSDRIAEELPVPNLLKEW